MAGGGDDKITRDGGRGGTEDRDTKRDTERHIERQRETKRDRLTITYA